MLKNLKLLITIILYLMPYIQAGLFCDGTRRYGVQAPFFQSEEKNYF